MIYATLFACCCAILPLQKGDPPSDLPSYRFDMAFDSGLRFELRRHFLMDNYELFQQNNGNVEVLDPINLAFANNQYGLSGYFGARAYLLHDEFNAVLNINSGELREPHLFRYEPEPLCELVDDYRCAVSARGRSINDEFYATAFIRELYFELLLGELDWLQLSFGKRLLSTGYGYILDNYSFSVSAEADFDSGWSVPWQGNLAVMFPNGEFNLNGKHSPYVFGEISYHHSLLERFSLFAAYMYDGDDNFAQILRPLFSDALLSGFIKNELLSASLYQRIQQAQMESDGHMQWMGLQGNLVFEHLSLFAVGIVNIGRFNHQLSYQNLRGQQVASERSVDSFGVMADLEMIVDLSPALTASISFLFMSGETFTADELDGPQLSNVSSFIAVYPYITKTNIFFSGGMNQHIAARNFQGSGVNGRGVVTPITALSYEISDKLMLKLVGALLFSHGQHLHSKSHFYGFETDLNMFWRFNEYLLLRAEFDYLHSGSFFDFSKPLEYPMQAVFQKEPDCYKIMLGVDFSY